MSATDVARPADAAPATWVDRYVPPAFGPYLRLARADRPIGIWLLLWPCWWSILLAASQTLNVSVTMDQAGSFALFTGSSMVLARTVTKGGASSFTYTAPGAGSYRVHVFKEQALPVNYTMSIR